MSRLLKIGFVSVLAVGVLFLGYWLSNKESPSENIVTPPQNSDPQASSSGGSNVPSESLGASRALFEGRIYGYFADSGEVLAVNEDGHVFRKIGSEIETLSSSSVSSVARATFSFDGKRILLETGFSDSPFFKVFNVDKKTWKDLPPMTFPAWSPKTHELVFLDKKSSGNSLSILNVDSPTPRGRTVLQANFEDINLLWPQTNWIILSEKGSAYSVSSAWKVDLQKKIWTPIVVERSSLDTKWKGDGSSALVLTGSGRGGRLTLINDRGEALKDLSVLTLPNKCAFAGEDLVCAVPENKKKLETSFLPDDYFKEDFFTSDSFLNIDLGSGEVETLSSGKTSDATNLQIRGGEVFFINRLDGKLYSFKK